MKRIKDVEKKKFSNNLIGQRFGRLVVQQETKIETASRISKGWRCKCDCGNTIDVVTNGLTGRNNKGTRSCGCIKNPDIVGHVFGKLLVVSKCKFDRVQYWRCKCHCGGEISATGTKLKNGHTQTCGHCKKNIIITHNPEWLGGKFIPDSFVLRIINSAKTRDIEYNLTVIFLENLFLKQKGKCALTGELLTFPQNSRDTFTASLDRIDSSKDYTKDNVQWVHKDVNILKMDNADEELINWSEKIVEHNKHKQEQIRWVGFLNFWTNF